MRHEVQVQLIERLLAQPSGELAPRQSRVPVDLYRSSERLLAERKILFREYPIPVAHVSELAGPGDYLTHDATGVPILVVRTRSGEIHAYANLCRHRGARIMDRPCGRGAKALVCPYHGWTYALDGQLLHVPRQELFPGLDRGALGLMRLAVACAHGIIWVVPRPMTGPGQDPGPSHGLVLDIDEYLGQVGDDLTHFSAASHHLYRKVVDTRDCNWKLIIEAFLEGYHVRTLHRESIARYFSDRGICFDVLGMHMRSIGPRKNLPDMAGRPREEWNIRHCATPFYYIFPDTIIVVHPDFLSILNILPLTTDRSQYTHLMLTPGAPESQAEHEHWQRSFELIEETVYQKEDLAIAENLQKGVSAGIHEQVLLGGLEYPIRVFHDHLDLALARHGQAPGPEQTP